MRKYNRLMMRIEFIEEGKVNSKIWISYELIESNYDGSLKYHLAYLTVKVST